MAITDTTAARTATLLDADNFPGAEYYLKDESYGAGTNENPITISPESGTINKKASEQITVDGGDCIIYGTGTNWFTVGL